jgi:hypothetical protein
MLHGRRVAEYPTDLSGGVGADSKWPMNEICTFVEDKLKVRDTQELMSNMRFEGYSKPRYVKTAQAQEVPEQENNKDKPCAQQTKG